MTETEERRSSATLSSQVSDTRTERPRPSARRTLRRPRRSARRREAFAGYAFIAPWIVGLIGLTLGPMIASLYFSFTEYSVLSAPEWIGVENYTRMWHDDLFWTSLYNTAYYAVFSVIGVLVLGLLVALLISGDLHGVRVFRTLFYMPIVVPVVANSLLWSIMFRNEGVINGFLTRVGLPTFNWLGDPSMVKLVYISMSIWALGTTAMIFVAGLRDVPITYYEAARIDGASRLQQFRHVTLPLLAPVILFNLVIGVINSFQVFTAAYVISSGAGSAGGPANSSMFYVLYLYLNAFRHLEIGYASAMAWVLFLIILAFTAIQMRVARSYVYYEAERP